MDIDYTHGDDLFRLGWLEDGKLREGNLRLLVGIASQLAKKRGAAEEDTGAIFVEPLLRGLGWETLDHDEVSRAPRGECPDYELYAGSVDRRSLPKRVVVLEVKRLDVDNRDQYFQSTGALRELRKYVRKGPSGTPNKLDQVVLVEGERAVFGAVTDGPRWHVYEVRGEREDLICNFDLRDTPSVQKFADVLGKQKLADWASKAGR